MAGIKGRTRVIAPVNELTGNTLCVEAVLAQKRPSWTPYAIGVAAVVGGFIVGLSGLVVLGGAIIGGLAGVDGRTLMIARQFKNRLTQ